MEDLKSFLKDAGLDEKETLIYLSLLQTGPTAIRKIAEMSGINRGTTYEALKKLKNLGLVAYFHQGKHQHFVAENPKNLFKLITRKKNEVENLESQLEDFAPALESLFNSEMQRPVVKFYENYSGIRSILEDVLDRAENEKMKEYEVYSSSAISPYLYHKNAFPNFTEERIKRKISVRAIATGPGGKIRGNDERKWLSKKEGSPTYTLIYSGKIAMISLGRNKIPHGVIIEDQEIFKTQKLIFDSLWKFLK